jgi:23S rRNA pseudouridine1911/1915/1917 synthase
VTPADGSVSPETILQSKVPEKLKGLSLLDYLCARFPYQGREKWSGLIARGKVRVNGQKPSPDQVLHKGNTVSYATILDEPPVDKDIRILHDEPSFLVALKPANLPSHADGRFITHTFIAILREVMKEKGYEGFLGLVHRLDRETSGLMIVAKDRTVQKNLMAQFSLGQVEKEYLAWVRGAVGPDRLETDAPIGKDPTSRISIRRKALPGGTPGAQAAHTRFEVVRRENDATLLLCRPTGGRTHQVRVHLEFLGHPVLGDKLYGRPDEEFLGFVAAVKTDPNRDWAKTFGAPRQLLHASRLVLKHPETAAPIAFEAPMPDDMSNISLYNVS